MDDLQINAWAALAIIIFCLALSAFFSMAETAVSAVSRARLLTLEKAGDARAAILNTLLKPANA